MTDHAAIIARNLNAINSLNDALPKLFSDAMSKERLEMIIRKELFSPSENEELSYWFARFISIRQNFWQVVDTAIASTGGTSKLEDQHDWHYFVMAYAAICSLIRMDRYLLTKVAYHKVIQRKLNEPFPEHRIARKQYRKISSALLLPANAIRIHQAHRLFKKKRGVIQQAINGNSDLELLFSEIPKQERYIDLSWRRFCLTWIRSRKYVWKRRGASAQQKSRFAVFEFGGRFVSELRLPRPKKVTAAVQQRLSSVLRPGDIFITRHNNALTNLFLPGFWPHAALYVGFESEQELLDQATNAKHLYHWRDQNCTLEALKDGVRFRSLQETLSVDAFVVIRPNLSKHKIGQAIARAVTHVGKGYNFDFDFFRSDRLVCTEVIYRAYEGMSDIEMPLSQRAGMQTLSAEDLLDLALDTDWATAIAIYGVGESQSDLVTGKAVENLLAASYR